MKLFGIFAILAAALFSMNASACGSNKSDGKDKGPQAQTTTTTPPGPVAKDASQGSK